jgi:hypothetical protein
LHPFPMIDWLENNAVLYFQNWASKSPLSSFLCYVTPSYLQTLCGENEDRLPNCMLLNLIEWAHFNFFLSKAILGVLPKIELKFFVSFFASFFHGISSSYSDDSADRVNLLDHVPNGALAFAKESRFRRVEDQSCNTYPNNLYLNLHFLLSLDNEDL